MITVVVSIYKVERYLNKCIESLLNQNYKDFEIILVDDGSPDKCPVMCDEWGKRDPRIRVFHKENGGLSSARNCGIEHAKGEFIIFPDPDDWVEPDYLERIFSLREEYDADLSICGHYYGENINNKNAQISILNTEKALEQLMMPRAFCGYAWNKLYSIDIIRKNNLRFDTELGMVQDLHFNVRYFQFCKKIVYDPKPLYHYVIDSGGVTSRHTALTPRKISGLKTYEKIAEITHVNYPYIESIAYASLCNMCLEDIYIYYKSGVKSKEIIDLLRNNFCKHRKIFYKSKAYTKRDKRFSSFVVLHPRVYYYVRRLYWRVIILLNQKTGK